MTGEQRGEKMSGKSGNTGAKPLLKMDTEGKNGLIIEHVQQNLKAERLNCLERQDALPAFIRKYLLFS